MTPAQALETAREQIHDCFLCGSPRLARLGCYVPRDPAILDVPMVPPNAQEQRTYWYGICHRCFKAGETAVSSRVEERIVALRGTQRN